MRATRENRPKADAGSSRRRPSFIDVHITIGHGRQAEYKLCGYKLEPKPGNRLDPMFFLEPARIQLLGLELQPMHEVGITFADGSRIEGRKASNGSLAWTCVDSSGHPTHLVKGLNGDLPECMAKEVSNGAFKYEPPERRPVTGDWIHLELVSP